MNSAARNPISPDPDRPLIPTRVACIAFTRHGLRLAETLRARCRGRVEVVTKASYAAELPRLFAECDGLVFVSSTGIAARLCAPFLQDKTRDPAVVVVDDLGRYAISLISGHLGGANALARHVAELLGAMPIITTASDGRGFEAVDLLAQRYDLVIENLRDAKTITAMMLDEQPIALLSEIPVTWNYPHRVVQDAAGYVTITSRNDPARDRPTCILRPKILHVGLGCRRGASADAILAAIRSVFARHNLALRSIAALASIDIKRDEPGLCAAADSLQRPVRWYSQADIRRVQDRYAASAVVQAAVGVSAVCEPCACLAGGDLIVGKTIHDGVTVAVAQTHAHDGAEFA